MDRRELNRKGQPTRFAAVVGRSPRFALIIFALVLAGCQNPLSEVVRDEVKYAKALSFTLNVEDVANAEVSPNGTFDVKEGYPEIIKAFPDNGYFFVEWEIDTTSTDGTVSFSDSTSASVEITVSGGDATIRPVVADSVGSIEINSGSQYSTTSTVALDLFAQNGNTITEMRISNSGTYADTNWQPYSTSSSWTLTSGTGAKTVYVWFKDDTGTVSPRYSDSIILDVDPPQVSAVSPSDADSGVDVDTNVQIQFNEPVNAATLNTSSIRIRRTSGAYFGSTSVSYNSSTRVATLALSGNLDYNNESYTVEVSTDVEDIAGNPLASNFSSSFTTKYKQARITYLDSVSSTNPYFQDFVVEGNFAYIISRNYSSTNQWGELFRFNIQERDNIGSPASRNIRDTPQSIISDGSYVYIGHRDAPIRKVNMSNLGDSDDEASYTGGLITWSGNSQIVKVYGDSLIGVSPGLLETKEELSLDELSETVDLITLGDNTYFGQSEALMSGYYNTLQSIYTAEVEVRQQGITSYEQQTLNINNDLHVDAKITSLDVYDGEYIVVGSDVGTGLVIYDVTNPDNMTKARDVSGISGVEDLSIWDQYAAVAQGNNGFGFVDLGTPDNHVLISNQIPNNGGEVHDIFFDGTYIYLLKGSSWNTLSHFEIYEVEIY